MQDLVPAKSLFSVADRMFHLLWKNEGQLQSQRKADLQSKIDAHNHNIDKALTSIVEANSPKVVAAFEKRIEELEEDKVLLEEKIAKCGTTLAPYHVMYRTAMKFLSNPYELWASGGYKGKRTVLKLVISDRIIWDRKGMYRTPKLSAPFRVLNDIQKQLESSVNKGFEEDGCLYEFSNIEHF